MRGVGMVAMFVGGLLVLYLGLTGRVANTIAAITSPTQLHVS